MNAVETIQSAIKEGMTVFDYSLDTDKVSGLFEKLVGKKGNVISIKPNTKTVAIDNILVDMHIDVIYINIYAKTLPFLGGAEDALRRDRPIVFIVVNKNVIQKHGYSIRDIKDFMLSVGYMNLKLAEDYYAFTYEYEPNRVLL